MEALKSKPKTDNPSAIEASQTIMDLVLVKEARLVLEMIPFEKLLQLQEILDDVVYRKSMMC